MSVETQAPAVPTAESGESPNLRWLLVVCCIAQFMVILDLSIVNVALPDIQSNLEFSPPALQWVVDAYAISFAGFLMFGGRAADHFGQRRTFVAALILFGLASLAGGAAPTRNVLVVARGVQGLAGAFMAASSLAIITASFAPGPRLNKAIGTWAAMNGLGGAAGVLLGGVLTQLISWRWVLLINPPIAIAAALAARAVVAERIRAKADDSFDLTGALTLTVGQIILVYGVVEAGLKGWGTFAALGPIGLGVVLLIAFGQIENRVARNPLIPFKELTMELRNANTIVILFSAALFPMWVLSSLYLQQVLGLSPLKTGLIFLPMTVVIGFVASRSGRLVGQFGVKPVLSGGLFMLTVGLLLFTRINSSGSGIVYIMIPGLLTSAGIAMSIVPSTIAATQGAKPGQAGLASGMVNTSRQVGGGLGLAILLTLATQRSTHLIGSGQQVNQALTNGFRLAYLIGAGLAGAALLLTLLTVPRHEHSRRGAARPLAGVLAGVFALFIGLTAAFAGNHAPPLGHYSKSGAYTFVSAPGLHPPVVKRLKSAGGGLSPGYVLMTNFYNLSYPPIVGQSGPMILDRNMQPVWFQPVPEKVLAVNLDAQRLQGRPVLTWWQGRVTNTGATETGEDIVVDQHYRVIARLKATGGWVLTLHEFLIDGENAWVTANKNIPLDLSRYGGAYNGALVDAAVQEYNLRTGRLVRSWDALKHIPLRQAQSTLPTNGFPWDAYHINSIDISRPGKFLVSMRNTWAAYMVDAASGRIEWTLGGRNSDFRFGPGAHFEWQHDVRLQPGSQISMFDDHCCQLKGGGESVKATGPSRGLVLNLNERAHTASLVHQYGEREGFESEYMGRTQPLAGGDVFVGWGSSPWLSEYSEDGRLLFEAKLPGPDVSYRATLAAWQGFPLSPPAAALRRAAGRATIYASWNGATGVARWRVLGGASSSQLHTLATVARAGFETAIPAPGSSAVYRVQALDATGRVLGSSGYLR